MCTWFSSVRKPPLRLFAQSPWPSGPPGPREVAVPTAPTPPANTIGSGSSTIGASCTLSTILSRSKSFSICSLNLENNYMVPTLLISSLPTMMWGRGGAIIYLARTWRESCFGPADSSSSTGAEQKVHLKAMVKGSKSWSASRSVKVLSQVGLMHLKLDLERVHQSNS